jgi:hypothetical protein
MPVLRPPRDFRAANLAAALELAAAGIPVFPAIVAWNAESKKIDKKPAITGWQENATSAPQQITEWWVSFPDAVPAIELGRAGLVVIDLDRHPGAPDGVQAFKQICAGQKLPQAPTIRTPSGGFHIYFRQPAEGDPLGNGRGNLPLGIDVRGKGGWVVAPGAICRHGAWRTVATRPSLMEVQR